jgi:hypothetical protein
MLDLFQTYSLILNLFIAFAIIIHFLTQRTTLDRIHFIIIVAGFFGILHFFEGNMFYAQSFIVAWLILSGVKMMVSREVMLFLLLVVLVFPSFSPAFLALTFLFYVLVLWGFIYYALKEAGEALSHVKFGFDAS